MSMTVIAPDERRNAVERDYRAGVLPIGTICRKHGLDRQDLDKWVREHGWIRDLTGQVQREIEDRLARLDAKVDEDADIVDMAAAQGVAVVLQQRKDLQRLQRIADSHMGALERILEYGATGGWTKDDETKMMTLEPGDAVILGLGKGTMETFQKLMETYKTLITLQQEVFGVTVRRAEPGGSGASVEVEDANGGKTKVMFYLPSNGRD